MKLLNPLTPPLPAAGWQKITERFLSAGHHYTTKHNNGRDPAG